MLKTMIMLKKRRYELRMKTMRDYQDLHLKADILLLTDVF